MKTVKCDICGRTREDLSQYIPDLATIYHLKVSRWSAYWQHTGPVDIDVCGMCLRDIRQKNRKDKGDKNGD